MTRQQQDTLDLLALTHGRVAVRDGYADRAIRVTAPGGAHWIIGESGTARDAGVNHTTRWNESYR